MVAPNSPAYAPYATRTTPNMKTRSEDGSNTQCTHLGVTRRIQNLVVCGKIAVNIMDFKEVLSEEILKKRKLSRKSAECKELSAESNPVDVEESIHPDEHTASEPEHETSEPASNGKCDANGNSPRSRQGPGGAARDPHVLAMDVEQIDLELLKTDRRKLFDLISLFLKALLHEQKQLASGATRNPDIPATHAEIHKQCKEHLGPFFKLLKKQSLPDDILSSLATICSLMQRREYVRANDVYLKLAIGNAPWPIGVTAVGIHERSAQEKIKSNQVARMRL